MNEVTMKKEELRRILEENRGEHRQLFEEAHDAFREKLIQSLESRLDAARNGGAVELQLGLIEPVDHSDEYERALGMLSYEIADEVTLQQHEFAQLVEDDWGWKQNFSASYVANTGKIPG